MEGVFSIFQKKKQAIASERVNHKPLDLNIPETSHKSTTRIGPHIVPPKDDSSAHSSLELARGNITAGNDINKHTTSESKSQGNFFTRKHLQDTDITGKKKKAATAAAAAAEDSSKGPKRLSYKEYLKKMVGIESDSDDGVPLWEQADSDSEDEEAIRNARSRGF